MNPVFSIKFLVCSLGIAFTTAAWAQTPAPPTILYGTTTAVAPGKEFAITTTAPTLENPRAKYVVVAEANNTNELELLAWGDTTASLVPLSEHGIINHQDVVSVAAASLDESRIVTADINKEGVLSIHTWKVGPSGVVSQNGYRTAPATASQDVEIAAVSCDHVVTAYETTEGKLVVEVWSIRKDGRPSPEALLGKGPKVLEAYVAKVRPGQVVTAAGDSAGTLWVNTWAVDSAGVKALDQVKTQNALAVSPVSAPRPQTVAVGAGQSFELSAGSGSASSYDFVQSAFTTVITPGDQMLVYYWGIANDGTLKLQKTTTPTEAGDFYQVAASMLPRNIPITSYSGGTGDNNVFVEQYLDFQLLDFSAVSYSDPYGVVNIASAPAGDDFTYLSLFNPYNAYFVSAGLFNPAASSPDGTLFIKVLSYPEAPIL